MSDFVKNFLELPTTIYGREGFGEALFPPIPEEREPGPQINDRPAPAVIEPEADLAQLQGQVPLNLEYQLQRGQEDPPVDSDDEIEESEPEDETEAAPDCVMAPLFEDQVELPFAESTILEEVEEDVPAAVALDAISVEEEAVPVTDIASPVDSREDFLIEDQLAASVVEENSEGVGEPLVEDEAFDANMLQQIAADETDNKFIALWVAKASAPNLQSLLTSTASTVNISHSKVAVPGLEPSKSQNQFTSQKGREVDQNVSTSEAFVQLDRR